MSAAFQGRNNIFRFAVIWLVSTFLTLAASANIPVRCELVFSQSTQRKKLNNPVSDQVREHAPNLLAKIEQAISSSPEPIPRASALIREAAARLQNNLQIPSNDLLERKIISDYLACLDFPILVTAPDAEPNPMEQMAIPHDHLHSLDDRLVFQLEIYKRDWTVDVFGIGTDPLMPSKIRFQMGLFSIRSWLNGYANNVELIGVPDQPQNVIDTVTFQFGRSLSRHDLVHAYLTRRADLFVLKQRGISPIHYADFMNWKRNSISMILEEIDRVSSPVERAWRETVLFYLIHEVYISLPLQAQEVTAGHAIIAYSGGREVTYSSVQDVARQLTTLYSAHHSEATFKMTSLESQKQINDATTWIFNVMAQYPAFAITH